MSGPTSTTAARLWPLYLGGFLGPFGGQLVIPMLPEVADTFGTSLQVAAYSLSTYTLTFAILLLISGTLAAGWGRHRTVRTGYLVYAGASLLCAASPAIGWFLAARGLQGAANAFTTPLLVAAIFDTVPREHLGRSLGIFSSLQAAGMAFAPLVGGLAGAVNFRFAFMGLALVAAGLAFAAPRDSANAAPPGRDRWRSLANVRLARVATAGFFFNLSTAGILVLGALWGADAFGLGPTERGLVIAAYGAVGLLAAPILGRAADRIGVRRLGGTSLAVVSVTALATGLTGGPWALVVVLGVAGAAVTGGRLTMNTLAVTSTPANPPGATSMTMSWMFIGTSVAPLLLLPLYLSVPLSGFVVAAACGLVATMLVLVRLKPPPTVEP